MRSYAQEGSQIVFACPVPPSTFGSTCPTPSSTCVPELVLSPKSCYDFLGIHVCAWAFAPIPGARARSRDVSRPQVPVPPKALPWAVMVSIDTDVDSACPSSG